MDRWNIAANHWTQHASSSASNFSSGHMISSNRRLDLGAQTNPSYFGASGGPLANTNQAIGMVQPGSAPSGMTVWRQSQHSLPITVDQFDLNPQSVGPWIAPQPTEINNDMMWHDPNPKQKKVFRDTGTGLWGDPIRQATEIKHWKDAEYDDYSHIQSATVSGGDWSNIPLVMGQTTNPPPISTNNGEKTDGNVGWDEFFKNTYGARKSSTNDNLGIGWPDNKVRRSMESPLEIPDMVRVAAARGLINISMLNQSLSHDAFVGYLGMLMTSATKLDECKEEYSRLITTMNSNSQKVETEHLALQINALENEVMQLRNRMHDNTRKGSFTNRIDDFPNSDGQSRLKQWKEANKVENEKAQSSICDQNIARMIAATQNLSFSDKAEKNDQKCDQNLVSVDRTPKPNERTNNATPISKFNDDDDNGPQEFVPGKKWEWKDPNRVAEDPNATPGNCKPNPLLSTTINSQFYAAHNTTLPSENKNAKVWNSMLAGTGTGTASGTSGSAFLASGTNIPPGASYGVNDAWQYRPCQSSSMNQQAYFSQRMPIMNQQSAIIGAGMAQRSVPVHGAHQYPVNGPQWILIQLHGVNDKQVQMLCQRVGQITQIVTAPGSPFLFVKFAEQIDEVVRRLKIEAPFLQLKTVYESEIERLMKMRSGSLANSPVLPITTTASGWNNAVGQGIGGGLVPHADPSWFLNTGIGQGVASFGGQGSMPCDALSQQSSYPSDDLSRQF